MTNIESNTEIGSAGLLPYATFLVPLVFALLVGVNIWVWNWSRINYQFIFGTYLLCCLLFKSNLHRRILELDVRTQLDSREYFEVRIEPTRNPVDKIMLTLAYFNSCLLSS